MVNSGVVSRYEIAREICRVLGREDIILNPVSSAYFPLPAPRARSEALRNLKLDLMGINPMRCWKDALGEYLTQEVLPLMASKG
jgi:dTDP-4-dehydrorhamnose reductase